ncbi:hypothetical protein OG735_05100 [Streptomyces sp. NBC_01210]|uniref:hypothetical protein n=1 Tax=Streptomyces sp. NBC_01210 TaxID=2903774 RepID=UPI002E0DE87E|nr:hypothetical protein OG735_05100 [Streptomyces sp. NBC_01210]
MTQQVSAVFVDASGSRRRLLSYVSVAIGAACVCFVVMVLVGCFGARPVGGPLPWPATTEANPAATSVANALSGNSGNAPRRGPAADGKGPK